MKAPRMIFATVAVALLAVAIQAEAFVIGTWDVAGPQTVTVKLKGTKTTKKKTATSDTFIFTTEGDFSSEGLSTVGAWTQKGKGFKVSADQPAVVESYFEDGFAMNGISSDVTLKSFAISGTESKGKIKGTMSFKIFLDLLDGRSGYVTSTYSFTGVPGTAEAARAPAREDEASLPEFIRRVVAEIAPNLAAEVGR